MDSTKRYKVLELIVSEEDKTKEPTLIAKLSEITDNDLSLGGGKIQFSLSEYSPIDTEYFLLSKSSDKAQNILENKKEEIVININNFVEHEANIDGEYVDAYIHKSLFVESEAIRDIIEGKYRFDRVSKTFAPIDDFPENINEIDIGIRIVKGINEPKIYRAYFFNFEEEETSWDLSDSFAIINLILKNRNKSRIFMESKNDENLNMTLHTSKKEIEEITLHDLEDEIDRRYFNEG